MKRNKWINSSALIAGCFSGLISQLTYADRHCASALDYYYQARQIAIEAQSENTTSSYETNIDETNRLIESAITEATNCGCNELRQQLQLVLKQIASVSNRSESASQAYIHITDTVLDAQSALEETLAQCH